MNFTNIVGSGTVTLGNPGSLSGVTANGVTTSSHTHSITTGAVTNGGTAIPEGNDVYDFVIGLGYTSNTGTITGITGGNGLTGGGGTGSITLNVGNGNGIAAAANSIGLTTLSANWNAGSSYEITAKDFISSSDKRLKTNIKPIDAKPLDIDL